MRARLAKPRAGRLRAEMLRRLRLRLLWEAERRLDEAADATNENLTVGPNATD